MKLSCRIRPYPSQILKDIEAKGTEAIDGVGILGNPASIRVWTTIGAYFDRVRTTPLKKYVDLWPLLRQEMLLTRRLFNSLTSDQRLQAKSRKDGCSCFEECGGLTYGELSATQKKTMVEIDQIRCETAALNARDQRPGKPESYKIFYWKDKKTGLPQGMLCFGDHGALIGAMEIGGKLAERARMVQLQDAKKFYESLSPSQHRTLQMKSIPFSDLTPVQQRLFLQLAETKLILSGEGRRHLEGPRDSWRVAYKTELSGPFGVEKRPVIFIQLRSVGEWLPVDGKPFAKETELMSLK